MGFREVRVLLIEALRSANYDGEQRADVWEKNLLHTGQVNAGFVVRLLGRCAGWEYDTSPHHSLEGIWCHVFTPRLEGDRWYIKAYFRRDGVAMFISVHP